MLRGLDGTGVMASSGATRIDSVASSSTLGAVDGNI